MLSLDEEGVRHELTARDEVVWVQLAPDKKREGEIIGYVAEGPEKGKICFFDQHLDPRYFWTWGFCPVLVRERKEKFLKVHTEDFKTGGVRLASGHSFYGPLVRAKALWNQSLNELEKAQSLLS